MFCFEIILSLFLLAFPVVMYRYESWTIKKAERWRIDAFEVWCWRRLLRVPWTARRSNQSILKEISPGVHWKDWCWGWNSNTLATWCKELTHLKRPWCWEGLRAGGEEDDRGWDGWMVSPTQWTWVWVDSRSWWWTGRPGTLQFMGSQRVGHDWVTELNWTISPYSSSVRRKTYRKITKIIQIFFTQLLLLLVSCMRACILGHFSRVWLFVISVCVSVCVLVAQLCLILCDPMDCSLPGSSVCGILQARILEWVAMPSSRASFWPRDWTCVSCIAGRFFTIEPPEKPEGRRGWDKWESSTDVYIALCVK